MPISIPTSVAGVSAPGGPLAKLYEKKNGMSILSYPRSLQTDASRLHYVSFTIWEKDASAGDSVPVKNSNTEVVTNSEPQQEQSMLKKAINTGSKAAEGAFTWAAENVPGVKELKEIAPTYFRKDIPRKPGKIINLYIPDTVNVQYNMGYDPISLTNALGTAAFVAMGTASIYNSIENNPGTKVVNALGSNPYVVAAGAKGTAAIMSKKGLQTEGLDDLALRSQGFAYNPQTQLIFKGVELRTFQFDFTLTPYSQQEAEDIKQIVKLFKLAGSPAIRQDGIAGLDGLFFDVPDPFEIFFFHNGKVNDKVHRLGRCVLMNVNVDYAPMGWVTFGDGHPVQTKLTLQFRETEIVDRAKIQENY